MAAERPTRIGSGSRHRRIRMSAIPFRSREAAVPACLRVSGAGRRTRMFICKLIRHADVLSVVSDRTKVVKLVHKVGDRASRRRLGYSYPRGGYRISVWSAGAASV